MKMRKTVSVIAFLCVLVFAFASACGAAEKAQKLLYLGAASVGSAAYASSSGVATVISNNSDYIRINCQATSGANENYAAMLVGDMDMMFIAAGFAYRLGHPEIPQDSPVDKIYDYDANPDMAFFMNCEPGVNTYIVRADSDIKTIQDILKPGIRIGFPTPGGAAYNRNKALFEALGFNLNDLNIYYAERGELVDAFKDSNIDVIVGNMGNVSAPNSTIYELSLSTDVRLISLDEKTQDLFNSVCPAYLKYTIPAGWMEGVDTEVLCIVDGETIVINKNMPDDLVYDMCKALYDNLDELYKLGESFEYITKETAVAQSVMPIHSGALKYYEENGFTITYAADYVDNKNLESPLRDTK